MLYDYDTLDVGYNQKLVEVENTMYCVVHNNHWLKLNLNEIVNYIMFPYYFSAVFVKILCFCQLVKNLLIEGLVPIISIFSSETGYFCDAE